MADTSEDIAFDVASRIIEKNMTPAEAFKQTGYSDLLKHTRESDMPVGWETLPEDKMVKVLVKVIDKARKRSKVSRELVKVAKIIMADSLDTNEIADNMARLILGDRKIAINNLKNIKFDFNKGSNEDYNKIYLELYKDIKRALDKTKNAF